MAGFPQAPSVGTVGASPPARVFAVAPLLDFDAGDIVTGGDGKIVWADPITTWSQRFMAMCLTRQNSTPLYPRGAGNTFDRDRRQIGRTAQEAAITADLHAIATADPWTDHIGNVVFAWSGDGLNVTFDVTSVRGDVAPLALAVGGA